MDQTDREFIQAHQPRVEFPTTQWDMVMTAGNGPKRLSREALEKFCRGYWRPIYAYIRQQNRAQHDAEDLTQEFFARFLENSQINQVDPERGRLRTFLLTSVKSFLANEWAYVRAAKRGGGRPLLSLEELHEGEPGFLALIADPTTPPDQVYEYQWVDTLLNDAQKGLQRTYATIFEPDKFSILMEYSWQNSRKCSQEEIANELGMTPNAVGSAVHRIRRLYREGLREAVARTVTKPEEIEDELRHLYVVMRAYLGVDSDTNGG